MGTTNTFNALDTESSDLIVDGSLDINVIPLGPAGITSPIGSFNTISVITQQVVSQDSTVIDRNLGEYVQLILQSNRTSLIIQNWPSPPYLGRIHLDIYSKGPFMITWPPGSITPAGGAPQLTPSGNDLVILTTINGGTNIKINTWSNYLLII